NVRSQNSLQALHPLAYYSFRAYPGHGNARLWNPCLSRDLGIRENLDYPEVRAGIAFPARIALCEEASACEPFSLGVSANILLSLRPRSAGVKGFWIRDTPGVNMSARINSPLYPVM